VSIKALLTVGVAPVDLTCRSHAHFTSFAAVPTGTGVAAAVWLAGLGAAVGSVPPRIRPYQDENLYSCVADAPEGQRARQARPGSSIAHKHDCSTGFYISTKAAIPSKHSSPLIDAYYKAKRYSVSISFWSCCSKWTRLEMASTSLGSSETASRAAFSCVQMAPIASELSNAAATW